MSAPVQPNARGCCPLVRGSTVPGARETSDEPLVCRQRAMSLVGRTSQVTATGRTVGWEQGLGGVVSRGSEPVEGWTIQSFTQQPLGWGHSGPVGDPAGPIIQQAHMAREGFLEEVTSKAGAEQSADSSTVLLGGRGATLYPVANEPHSSVCHFFRDCSVPSALTCI